MIYLMIFVFCFVSALGLGVLAGWTDFRGLTIPNILPALILASFVPAYAVSYFAGAEIFSSLGYHVGAGFFVLLITFILFSLKVIGGGDSKLLSAYALWIGFKALPIYLFYTALIGALLGVAALLLKRWKPFKNPSEGGWIARVQGGENKVPYGIPIAIGALIAFLSLGYPTLETLALFMASGSS